MQLIRIIGIDPGSLHMGWGVIEQCGTHSVYIASGVLHGDSKHSLPERLQQLGDGLHAVLKNHQPHQGAVEASFQARNTRSAMILSHARGVALYMLATAKIPSWDYSATQIKQALTDSGRAEKQQVQKMVGLLLNKPITHFDLNESDALAIALTHAAHTRFNDIA